MENIRYFASQVFDDQEQLSYPEALERSWYVACHFIDETPDFAEVIGNGKVDKVVYYNRNHPDEALVSEHISRYKDKDYPFEVITPDRKIQEEFIREIYFCNSAGELQSIVEEHSNLQGNLIMEVRMDSNKNPCGKIQYYYNTQGDLRTGQSYVFCINRT